MTDTEQMLEWDVVVSDALGKRRSESIMDAAQRVLATPHGNPAWRVAAVFTSRDRVFDSWRQMRDAAKAARRLQSAPKGGADHG